MPILPIPRRMRSFQGPHSTCMFSACGVSNATKISRSEDYNYFDLYRRSSCINGLLRLLLYFGVSMLLSLLWVALSALFLLQYICVRVLLRMEYKVSVMLLLLGHQELELDMLHDFLLYSMEVTMLLVGGLGFCFMSFVEI